MTFFLLTTLMLFLFSHWATIKPIFRSVIKKQLRKEITWCSSDQPLESTFKDACQMECSFFLIMGMITCIFWKLSMVSKENLLAFPIAVWREAHKFVLTSLTSSLRLDDGYLGSMFWQWYKWWCELTLCRSNRKELIVLEMHDLWPKVVEETKTQNLLEMCSWQRWEITQANHNFECNYKSFFTHIFIKVGYHIQKYRRYQDDSSVP